MRPGRRHRRSGTHPDRQGQGQRRAARRAARRSAGAQPERTGRPHRGRPGADRRRHRRRGHPGGRSGGQHRTQRVLGAGFPETVPGTTVDRQCGSSQQAISFAAQGVIAGAYDIVVAAGVESMSRVPMGSRCCRAATRSAGMAQRYPEGLVPQGISAELIAAKWGFSRAAARRVLRGQPRKGRARQPKRACSTTSWRRSPG